MEHGLSASDAPVRNPMATFVGADLPPLAPPPPFHPPSPPSSSPHRRPNPVGTGAVIRSPMAPGVGGAAGSDRATDDTSPLSTATAAEYAAIEQKQLELRGVVERRIMALERTLARREEELASLRAQLRKTEEDYQFNYDLIKDRDAALEEAAAQLQRVYEELRRQKADAANAEGRVEGLERERDALQRRLREAEGQQREATEAQHVVQREAAVQLEAERQRLHEAHLGRLKSLDDAKLEAVAAAERRWRPQVEALEAAQRECREAQRQQQLDAAREVSQLQQQLDAAQHEAQRLQQRGSDLHERLLASRLAGEEAAARAAAAQREAAERVAVALAAADSAGGAAVRRLAAAERAAEEARRVRREADGAVVARAERAEAAAAEKAAEAARGAAEKAAAAERVRAAEERLETERRASGEREADLRREAAAQREELERQRRFHEESTQRAAAETSRLARELHASEAAREVLHTQVREWEDQRLRQVLPVTSAATITGLGTAPTAAVAEVAGGLHVTVEAGVLEALRRERTMLTERVLELERTNASVREQVAAFTTELQNDPAVRAARETQRRAAELEDELRRARDETERLRAMLDEKAAEVARYQREILRDDSPAHARLREEYRSARNAYDRMRSALRESRHGSHPHHQHDDKNRNHSKGKDSDEFNSDNSDDSDSASSLVLLATGDVGGRRRGEGEKEKRRRKKGDNGGTDAVLLREAELWRRKCAQLEQQLHDAIRERDEALRELRNVRREAESMVSEKQSLVDLNSLLKAQLREAYRTAIDYPLTNTHPHPRPQSSPSSATHVANATGTGMTTAPMVSSPSLAVDNVLDAGRIAALEEEIAAVKAHMATQRQSATTRQQTTQRRTSRQSQGQSTSRRTTSVARGPIVRQGGTAIGRKGTAVFTQLRRTSGTKSHEPSRAEHRHTLMGASSSRERRSGRHNHRRNDAQSPPENMPPHLANQYNRHPQERISAGPSNPGPTDRGQQQQQDVSPPTNETPQQTNGSNNANASSNPNQRGVQEGQIVKMLATIDATSVKFDLLTGELRFSVTSTCPSLTYEVHSGVKEYIKNGEVFYMPNKPKMEPPRISVEGALENKGIAVKIDVSRLEEKERVYNKHYPKQQPCVVVLRYRTKVLRKADGNDTATEEIVEQTEHTAVDLAENPKRRVISQVITTGDSAYVVENLFGVDGESAGGACNPEVTIGDTLAPHDGEEDEDGLCVICLTMPKDTAVMPCRHMCLCKDCAKELMRHTPKCPVCRGSVSTLLHMPTVNAE